MEFYEIVIIGAGPGGLNCAQKLAEAGKQVLLLEKNSEIGPKICAGGVTAATLDYLSIPDELLGGKFDEIVIGTPRQKQAVKSDKAIVYTIDRKDLGHWQLERLKKTKAVARTKARVTEIGKDFVVVNGSEKIGFKYLVGADGSASIVRRFLGIKTKDLLMSFQYNVPGEIYKKLEMHFSAKLFSLGYAWIFPQKGYASIGCGCVPSFLSAKKLRDSFAKWLKAMKIDVSGAKLEAFPISFDYQGYKFGNIFLIGDAAGLASGLTGGGIHQALISAEETVKSIFDSNYISRKMEEIAKKKKTHKRVLNFLAGSGPLVKTEIELLALLLKTKWFTKILTKSIL
jgi:geranylgeranyl reductase family protein